MRHTGTSCARRWRRWSPAIAAGFITLTLAACGGSTDESSDANGAANSKASPERSSDELADSAASSVETATGNNAAADAVPARQPLRLRAVSGTLAVRIATDAQLTDTLRTANAAISGLDGFVFSQDSNFGVDASATVTYKVPPDRFNDAVTALSELGTPVSSDVDTSDVTDQVVDLDARIASASASVTRVRALLAEANNLGEVTSLEGELTRRETVLEQLNGQRRQTIDTVEMSTLTATFTSADAPVVSEDEPGWLASVPGFGSALSSGWNALSNVLRVVAALVGYTAPFLVLTALALATRRLILGRRLTTVGPESGRDGEI